MKKIVIFLASIYICISLVWCANNIFAKKNIISHNTFNVTKAISMVIKSHTDFPSNTSDTKIKKLFTGGPPQSNTTNVKFTTKIEKDGENTYLVTLIKDWGITVNGKYAKSSWKYKVTPSRVALLESIDNDYLPNIIK